MANAFWINQKPAGLTDKYTINYKNKLIKKKNPFYKGE